MFGLFKKKSKKERLQKEYEKLLKQSYDLSKTNREESDKKAYEADLVAKEMQRLDWVGKYLRASRKVFCRAQNQNKKLVCDCF